jgi:hypothetical protein
MHLHTLALQYHGLGKLGENVSRAEVGTNILHSLRRDDILAGILTRSRYWGQQRYLALVAATYGGLCLAVGQSLTDPGAYSL